MLDHILEQADRGGCPVSVVGPSAYCEAGRLCLVCHVGVVWRVSPQFSVACTVLSLCTVPSIAECVEKSSPLSSSRSYFASNLLWHCACCGSTCSCCGLSCWWLSSGVVWCWRNQCVSHGVVAIVVCTMVLMLHPKLLQESWFSNFVFCLADS